MVYAKARRAVAGGVVSLIFWSRGGHRRTRASYESWKRKRGWKPSRPGIAEESHNDEDAGNYYRRPQVTDHVFCEALAMPNPTRARCCCAVLSRQVVAARAGELRDQMMITMRRRGSAPDAGASPQGSIGTTTTIIIMDRRL